MRFSIPTPTISVVGVGPFTVHFYALCIIAGVAIAIWYGDKRFTRVFPSARGVVADVSVFAIPAGVIGGRLYHVISNPELYFGDGRNTLDAFKIWQGGLGIWGAISLGSLVAWLMYRRLQERHALPPFTYFADAVLPGVLIAQAIGRVGNWFNAELFGGPLHTFWALEIPPAHRPQGYEAVATFHPTFAYEALWCLASAALLISLGTRLRAGAIAVLYITTYTLGRFFIEGLRIDPAHTFVGLRINQILSAALFSLSIVAFLRFFNRPR